MSFRDLRRSVWLAALVCLLSLPGLASAVTFRWANTGDAQSMDPHGHNEGFTLGFNGNIYDTLVQRDGDLKRIPGLALSWKHLDPSTWEFTLRKGVTFHDGTPFTADDVVFSWQRATSANSDVKTYLLAVQSMEAKDPHTVIVRTKGPDPILLSELTFWRIMSKAWCEKNGAVEVTNFSKNMEVFATRHANGTGPYMLVSREADVRTVLKRNPNWWGWAAGTAKGNVDEIVFTPIKQDGTRVAALLSGSVDMLYEVPIQDLDRVRAAGSVVYQRAETRTIFIGMDQARTELLESSVKGKNPFKDKRVRMAMYQAIDEDLIIQKIMRGSATLADGYIVKGVAGFNADQKRFPYNPDAARALLAEAGYPDGFEVGFDCPNDRYVNDAQICQAIVAMWARIGVRAKLLAQTKSLFFTKTLKRDTSTYMLGWSPATLDGLDVVDNLFVTPAPSGDPGRYNVGGYSNPEVDAAANQARTELDAEKRTHLLERALHLAHEDAASIPLHHQQVVWAVTANVSLVQRANNFFYWPDVTVK
jgi:peptide/nickel transport system substrate-binding protein